jgi:hypothetical protein
LYAASAFAVDATWVNTNSAATASWYTLANWIDANGDTPEVLPTNITDTVTLAPLPHEYALLTKIINTPQSKSTGGANDNPKIASLSGERAYRVEHTQRQSGMTTVARQMYIGNPDSFLGYLSVGDSRASYAFGATPSYSPLVHNIDPYRRIGLDVVEAGTTVKVARVARGGFMEKTGDGTLSVESTTGMDNSVYVKGGTLELVGRGEGDDAIDEILANALLHLDASVASTLETNMVDESGNVCVTRWHDVRGGNWPYAVTNSYTSVNSQYYFPYTRAPYIAEETSPSGKRLISFGSNVNIDGDSLGPTNCLLQLSTKLTTVREAFAVILAPRGMASRTVLGDVSAYDFIHYGTSYIGETKAVDDFMIDGVRQDRRRDKRHDERIRLGHTYDEERFGVASWQRPPLHVAFRRNAHRRDNPARHAGDGRPAPADFPHACGKMAWAAERVDGTRHRGERHDAVRPRRQYRESRHGQDARRRSYKGRRRHSFDRFLAGHGGHDGEGQRRHHFVQRRNPRARLLRAGRRPEYLARCHEDVLVQRSEYA